MEFFNQPTKTEFILASLFGAVLLWGIIRNISIGTRLRQSSHRQVFKLLLRSAIFGLLLVALLGPSFGNTKKEIKAIGKDIFIAIDLSNSMNADDIAPTRIEKIKFELKKLISRFPTDRLGIIIFGSEAFIQCPLTYDQNALNLFTEALNTGLIPYGGTDLAKPLELALEKLTDKDDSKTSVKAKAIVLISDGEDHGDLTSETVDQIRAQNMRVFCLGVGTTKGTKITGNNGVITDAEGNPVITRLDAYSMKQIAARTNGEFFELSDQVNEVPRLISTLTKIEGELRDTKKMNVSANKYFYFLFLALGLIVADVLLKIRNFKI